MIIAMACQALQYMASGQYNEVEASIAIIVNAGLTKSQWAIEKCRDNSVWRTLHSRNEKVKHSRGGTKFLKNYDSSNTYIS